MIDNLTLELRRGAIVLAVLSQLEKEQYGYSLIKLLADRGMEIDQGTIYPLLRRLEAKGLRDRGRGDIIARARPARRR